MPAPLAQGPPRLVRFGLFELDLKTGELRKKGVRLHLQEQPFKVLAMLLERAGDLVTRDELRARLWPDDVFVDFDQGVNKVVAKLRGALGDLAESPRFVETLERRGYRFIAPVAMLDAPTGAARQAPHPTIVRFTWGDQVIVLGDGVHVIGRDPAAAIWVDSSVVSRRHASVSVAGGAVTIEDLGSRNGTLVNGTRIAGPVSLAHGDQVRVGPAHLVVRTAPADSPTLTAVTDP